VLLSPSAVQATADPAILNIRVLLDLLYSTVHGKTFPIYNITVLVLLDLHVTVHVSLIKH